MKTIVKVTLIALLWVAVVNPGKIYGDTLLRLQMAHAWWTGTEEVSDGNGVLGVGGKYYLPYDAGQPLLMLPADWLGTQLQLMLPTDWLETQLHRSFPKPDELSLRRVVVNLLVFVPLNVAAVVACFWLLRLFNFSEGIAGLASLTWLLGTTVLHYAQIAQQNNQILLFVTIGYATALACVLRNKSYWAVVSGLAMGAAFLIRMTSFIHIFTVFLFLAGCLLYQIRDRLKILQELGWWLIGLMPLILLGRLFDYLRFGSFWTTGMTLAQKQMYADPLVSGLQANYPFNNPPWVGTWGALFSPAKSIFIYDPLLIPCLVLGIVFWKKLSPYIQWYLITAIFNLGLHIVFYSKLDFWHGDGAWGARYHVTSVHLLLIPLIALFIEHLLTFKGVRRWVMSGVIALAIIVQITSIVLNPSVETGKIFGASPSSFNEFRLGERIQNIGCLLNPSFSQDCSRRLWVKAKTPLFERVMLLPFKFTQGRGLILMLWGLVLISAIASTLYFCHWCLMN